MTLSLIGIGLTANQISVEALQEIKSCQQIFLEAYTSKFASGSIKEFEKLIGKKITLLYRNEVENQLTDLLSKAKKQKIALLVYGNSLSATTHSEILIQAKKMKIQTKIFLGISVFDAISLTGLSQYSFGKTISIPFWQPNFKPESFYDKIKINFENGFHSLVLLDLKPDENKFMTTKQALEMLNSIQQKRNENWLSNANLICCAGLSSEKQQIKFGKLADLQKIELKQFPQCLVVCAKLSEKEIEFLQTFYKSKK